MLNKFAFSMIIITLFMSAIYAQTDQPIEEIENFEIYGGVTLVKDFTDYLNPNIYGLEGAYVKNVNSFMGVKANANVTFNNNKFSTTFGQGTENPQTGTVEIRNTDYNFSGGVQFKDNRKEAPRLRPFAHALVGVAVNNSSAEITNSDFCNGQEAFCSRLSETSVGFSATFGGGLDVKVNDKISIRAIQVDYNPRRFADLRFQNNIRFGAGIVFH